MAILTKDELFKMIQEKLTDSDDDLTILENITDTLNSMDNKDKTDWKQKYEENDKAWRERYKARFSEPTATVQDTDVHVPDDPVMESKSANYTIDDLFKD